MAQNEETLSYVENRKYPRKKRSLSFEIKPKDAGFDIVGETKDLSCIGALCQVDRPIPEMTQLKLVLKLPDEVAECEGTVVRVQKNASVEDSYDIAIYFVDIAESEKRKIEKYIGK